MDYLDLEDSITIIDQTLLDMDITTESIHMTDGTGCKYRPVFIILLYSDSTFDHVAEKFVKNQKYWHAALGFGPSLSTTYSFNFGECEANRFKGGLSFESMDFYKREHPTGTCYIGCVLLTPQRFQKLQDALNYYITHKTKTKYSFINLLWALMNKKKKDKRFSFVCSTFVDAILKSVDVDLTFKQNNLVKPDDLISDNDKQIKIFEGKIIDYDPMKAAKIVEKYANNVDYAYFSRGGYSAYHINIV